MTNLMLMALFIEVEILNFNTNEKKFFLFNLVDKPSENWELAKWEQTFFMRHNILSF